MKFIKPSVDYVEFKQDNNFNYGLWPMHIYTYGIECFQINFTLFIFDYESTKEMDNLNPEE